VLKIEFNPPFLHKYREYLIFAKDQLQLVATALCNHMQLVVGGSVVVQARSKISATGFGPVASKKRQKTRSDQTLKH